MFRRTLVFLKPHRLRFGGGVALNLLGLVLDPVKPVPLDVILGDAPPPSWLPDALAGLGNVALLSIAAAAIVVVTFLRGAATVASAYLTIDTGQRMVNDLRTGLYAHLQKLSLKFHNKQQT